MSIKRTTVVAISLFCCIVRAVHADDAWSVSRIVGVIEAREQALVNLEVSLEIVEVQSADQRKREYEQRKLESMKLMAEAAGYSLPSFPREVTGQHGSLTSYRLRYVRGSAGKERIERFDPNAAQKFSKQPASIAAFDGEQWWALTGKNAQRCDAQSVSEIGHYIGLDLEWGHFGRKQLKTRSLARKLREFQEQGLVQLAPDKTGDPNEMVVLVVRHPTGSPFPQEVLSQTRLVFDPRLGMALIKQDYTLVRKVGEEFLQAILVRTESRWEDYIEVAPGQWLPRQYWSGLYEELPFPKTGTKYPAGFDFNKAYPKDYRLEPFLRIERKARVINVTFGQVFGPEHFRLELPRDVILHDTVNDRVYQTSDLIPMTLEDDLLQALASRRSGYGVWIWVIVANLLLIAAFGGWFWLRRRRAKMGPPNSAAQPSG